MENDGFSSKSQLFEFKKSKLSIIPTKNQVYSIPEAFRTPWAAISSKKPKNQQQFSFWTETVNTPVQNNPAPHCSPSSNSRFRYLFENVGLLFLEVGTGCPKRVITPGRLRLAGSPRDRSGTFVMSEAFTKHRQVLCKRLISQG